MSQVYAMTIKRFLYAIRNYILLIIQFVIPSLFVVLAMLAGSGLVGDKNLPELSISFDEYLQTVTTVAKGTITDGSPVANSLDSYRQIINSLLDNHKLSETNGDFQDAILSQYEESASDTNLKSMVGASFSDDRIVAFFNNQGYHTAPLTINLINNAILQ